MKKVLVVDNHRVIREFMTNFLEKRDCHVITAEDGLSALEALKTYTPDILFVDLIMPNIDGKKLCQIIRKMPDLKDVYIVILSGIVAEEKVKYTDFGANACIAKGPFNIMTKNVLTVLDQWENKKTGLPPEEIMGIESVHSRSVTQDLLSSQKHYEIILESMSEGILEVTSDAKVVYANPVAVSLLNKSDQTLLGCDFTELFQAEARKKIHKLLTDPEASSQTLSGDSHFELNGEQFSMKILPIKAEENRANIIILNDIRERKGMESKLRNAQKMEAIGTLAGGIAHDFNNLLMGVQGHTSLMLLQADPDHPNLTHLNEIEDLVQRGSDLTKQLLTFAREDKQDLRPANLNDIVEKTAGMFGRTRKEIGIRTEFETDLWPVVIDHGKIRQVLLNLYVNASQAMPGGGDLTLKTANVDLDGKAVKPVKMEPGPYVKIEVSDTGVGMDEKIKDRIFEPFFTTRELGKGTGLGLASAYGIIKNHGGFIDVQSEKGKGATFTIYLPSTKRDVKKKRNESKQILEGSETILLVDDEKIILNVGMELLQSMGYQVFVAGSGKEAIEVFKENQDKIDMIILDTIMPGMGGSETYEKLKEINPHIKVLLSSGYDINDQAVQILAFDCDGFIQKPFNMEDLSKSTRAVLDKDNGSSQ